MESWMEEFASTQARSKMMAAFYKRCTHVWREANSEDVSACLCVLCSSSNKDYMID